MKQKYNTPSIEIDNFEASDIITASLAKENEGYGTVVDFGEIYF